MESRHAVDCERVVVLVPIVGAAHATDDAAEALKFFAWAYAKGGQMAEELDFVPMPAKLSARFRRTGRRSRTTKDSRCSLRPAERQPLNPSPENWGRDHLRLVPRQRARRTRCYSS